MKKLKKSEKTLQFNFGKFKGWNKLEKLKKISLTIIAS
jgi:hypothetical protein